jgi:two-component system, chemotaxis family, protein-glutamate methylesterase/glutaminase
MKKIKVLIVDDSLFIRQMFTKILSADPEIEVISAAVDANDARDKIKRFNPDVITLDIEMPGMDGLTFLKKVMSLRPIPVIMASSLTQKGAEATIKALEIGAVDYVSKSSPTDFDADRLAKDLIEKVKIAAKAKVRSVNFEEESSRAEQAIPVHGANEKLKSSILFAIGSSTGGVEALREVLIRLPENFPPVVIVQHMPPKFTTSFSERLDRICPMTVKEAQEGDIIKSGHIYLAPGGDDHMEIEKKGTQMICKLKHGEKVSGHSPSVDVLFDSVAKNIGKSAYGVILTGMGKDGAKGLLAMKQKGCINLGQDEASSVVYGMPKAAYLAGAVDKQLTLLDIPKEMVELAKI